jgi:hypothetical protein
MQIKEFVKKIHGLPEDERKKILWTIVAIIGIILFIFWINSAKKNLEKADFSKSLPPFNLHLDGPGLETQGKQIENQLQKVLDQLNQQQQNTKEK